MSGFEDIREHMEVIGADGVHLGTVDRVEGDRIKLIRADSGIGHEEHHHYIPRGLVATLNTRAAAPVGTSSTIISSPKASWPRSRVTGCG